MDELEAEPLDQERDRMDDEAEASVRERDRARHNMDAGRRTQLYFEYSQLPVGAGGRKRGVGELEANFGVARGYISHELLPKVRNCPDGGLVDRPRSGRPHVIQAAEAAHITKFAETTGWEAGFREMADELEAVTGIHICPTTISNWMHDSDWRVHYKRRTLPLLTPAHIKDRFAFATAHKDDDWTARVDLDEKLFKTKETCIELKVPPGVDVEEMRLISKTQVPGVMFLVVVGKPSLYSDGKIALLRVAGEKEALRKSKNHEKGDVYPEDCTMTAEIFHDMVTQKVMPEVHKRYPHKKMVIIQQDNASPHTGHHMLARLNAHGKTFSNPTLAFEPQPARSPDTNICDLAFFRALFKHVKKLRRLDRSAFDKEQLVADVEQAWADFDSETITTMFDYKSHVMRKIVEVGGDNNYNRRRKTTPD